MGGVLWGVRRGERRDVTTRELTQRRLSLRATASATGGFTYANAETRALEKNELNSLW
jgi:hypothetical protein